MPIESLYDAAASLAELGFLQGEGDFQASWAQRTLWNIPGPVYVGDEDDSCGSGAEAAPNNVWLAMDGGYVDTQCGEFVFRQPSSDYEIRQIALAAKTNTTGSYGMDGNDQWTPVLVTEWWKRMSPTVIGVRSKVDEYRDLVRARYQQRVAGEPQSLQPQLKMPSAQLRRWLDYMENGAELYLEKYLAFLEQG